MRKLVLGLAALFAAETAALACSCLPPDTPAQSRAAAREAVQDAIAIVEVDVLSEHQFGRSGGERVRVRRTLWGRVPGNFRIARQPSASSASCDVLLTRGQRKTLIVRRSREGYGIQSLCSDYLTQPEYLPITLQEARRRRR